MPLEKCCPFEHRSHLLDLLQLLVDFGGDADSAAFARRRTQIYRLAEIMAAIALRETIFVSPTLGAYLLPVSVTSEHLESFLGSKKVALE
jgi:hypothetical protein